MRKLLRWFKSLFSSKGKGFLSGWYKDVVTGEWRYWYYNRDTYELYQYPHRF